MQFYNLKLRKHEEIANSECTKVVYNGKSPRYAFRAVGSDGTKLIKFCSKADYDAATDVPAGN